MTPPFLTVLNGLSKSKSHLKEKVTPVLNNTQEAFIVHRHSPTPMLLQQHHTCTHPPRTSVQKHCSQTHKPIPKSFILKKQCEKKDSSAARSYVQEKIADQFIVGDRHFLAQVPAHPDGEGP